MSELTVRGATMDDLPQIMPIYAYARGFMAATGNGSQWGKHFPPEKLIAERISNGELYVVEAAGAIHGAFAFIIGEDATYAAIENGSWLSNDEYGTIHQIAGDGRARGIMAAALTFCEEKIRHLRIDTHENNRVMRHLAEKHGFLLRGTIYTDDGSPRVAYERI